MANKIAEFFINSLLPIFEQMGTAGLVKVLQSWHDKEPEQYEVSIRAGHTFIKPLLKFVSNTPNKVDDGFVEAFDEAITMSAASNGIAFSDGA